MSVRAADPDTSIEAWVSMFPRLSRERAIVAAAVEDRARQFWTCLEGSTADDVVGWLAASGVHRQRNCVSSRLSELHKAGWLEDRGVRRMGDHGRPAIAWFVKR